VLSAWDAATGNLLWRRESGKEFSLAFPYFGAAASPLVWERLCFIHLGGDDRNKADNPGIGAMVALRVADGREQWRWAGDGPAVGASPIICAIGGSMQLIFKTKRKIVALDPRTGRELWQFPYRIDQDNTIVTPVILGDRLVTSDYQFGVAAWQIRSSGGAWTAHPLWRTREASLFMNSPVLAGGTVVGFSHFHKGQLFAVDPTNGKVLWMGVPRSGEHASLVSYGNHLLVFREDGWMEVGEVSLHDFRLLRRYHLGDSVCWGHPALVDNRILVRDGTLLAAYRF
jgi:outer membrane protein assembly factor BamB